MTFRVMGAEELIDSCALRRRADARYRMDRATQDLARRLDEILDREERAQRSAHGLESRALNEFLERRHREHGSLSDAIEAFRDHAFQDEAAGEDFQELLGELDRLRQLEEFLKRHAQQFAAANRRYETAHEVREQVEPLRDGARARGGSLRVDHPSISRAALGAGRPSLILPQPDRDLRDAGLVRQGDQASRSRRARSAHRRAGAAAVYSQLRNSRPGSHDTVQHGVHSLRTRRAPGSRRRVSPTWCERSSTW